MLLPMGFIGMCTDSYQRALRYDLVVSAIAANAADYLVLLAGLGASGLLGVGLVCVVAGWTGLHSPGFIVSVLAGIACWVVFVVGGYVGSRALGLFARYNRNRLPFEFGEDTP